MRKWTTLVVLVTLVGLGAWADIDRGTGDPANASLGVTVGWNANNWVIIYIPAADMSVDLGTVDGSLYDPGTGTWTPLTSGGHSVYMVTNNPAGLQLQVSGTLTSYPSGHPNPTGILGRLTLTSTTLGLSGALSGTLTYSTAGPGLASATDLVYTFTPSFDDVPGNYAVTVTYTVTTQ